MSTTRLPWFRMYTDFLNDPKLIRLAFEDQRHFIGVLALKSDGAIDEGCEEALLDRIVAQRLWIDHGVIREVKRRLIEACLIDSSWQPLAWDKRQRQSDKDSTAADRQRRSRIAKSKNQEFENQSRVTNRDSHATVTRLDTDTDTDTDTDKTTSYVETEAVSGEEVAENCLSIEKKRKTSVPYQEIVDVYHETLPKLPQVYKLTATRKAHIKSLWADELDDIESWRNYFKHINRSDFLMGRARPGINGRVFIADFDFIIKPSNFVKVAEEKYHGKKIQR